MSYKYMEQALNNNKQPISKNDLKKLFEKLKLGNGDIVIVHASLSKFGYIIGGARTVYEAIFEVIGKDGTIIVPSQTLENISPDFWKVSDEWIRKIKNNMPAFNKELSVSRGMGEFSEFIRNLKNSFRSDHPLYSFSGIGNRVEYILENHSLDYGLGENSPLGVLYKERAKILLLGTDFESNTSIHLAEYSLGRNLIEQEAKIVVDSEERWVKFKNIELDIYDDYLELQKKFLNNERGYKKEIIQNTQILLIDMRECVDFSKKYYQKKLLCE